MRFLHLAIAALAVTLQGQVAAPAHVGVHPFPGTFPHRFHHFRHFRHHHFFLVPLVLFADGSSFDEGVSCRDALRFVTGTGDLVSAIVAQPGAAAQLLDGLRTAGYPDVQLTGVEPLEGGPYRADYRLGRHDASKCA